LTFHCINLYAFQVNVKIIPEAVSVSQCSSPLDIPVTVTLKATNQHNYEAVVGLPTDTFGQATLSTLTVN